MIDPAENIVQAEAAIKRMREELQPMNAENPIALIEQARLVQDMMFQIERWAIRRSESKDGINPRNTFQDLIYGLNNALAQIEKRIGVSR
jgi:hypothetical protein